MIFLQPPLHPSGHNCGSTSRRGRLSADSGALLLREIMERTGTVAWMTDRLLNPRNPLLIT